MDPPGTCRGPGPSRAGPWWWLPERRPASRWRTNFPAWPPCTPTRGRASCTSRRPRRWPGISTESCPCWPHPGVRPAMLDGDTPLDERDWVRDHARWVLTNPDMLHRAVLPRHERWSRVLRRLRYVVVDECHAYRGVFGSHVALVLRRLRRLARRYGVRPRLLAGLGHRGRPGDRRRAPDRLVGDRGDRRRLAAPRTHLRAVGTTVDPGSDRRERRTDAPVGAATSRPGCWPTWSPAAPARWPSSARGRAPSRPPCWPGAGSRIGHPRWSTGSPPTAAVTWPRSAGRWRPTWPPARCSVSPRRTRWSWASTSPGWMPPCWPGIRGPWPRSGNRPAGPGGADRMIRPPWSRSWPGTIRWTRTWCTTRRRCSGRASRRR